MCLLKLEIWHQDLLLKYPKDADKRKIKDGDLCKIYNGVGETYAYAVVMESMLEGVASTQKQYKGSLVKNGVNANALNTQM